MRLRRDKDKHAAGRAASGDPDLPGPAASEPESQTAEARLNSAARDLPCPGPGCHVWHCDPDMEARAMTAGVRKE